MADQVVKLNYTVEEAAFALGVSERQVRNLIRTAALPSFKLGGNRLVNVRQLEAWNEAQSDPRVESARQAS